MPVNANIGLETTKPAEAPTVISGEFQLETLAFAPETKPAVEKVDTSPYLEAEAKKAEEARKAAQRRNLTVSSGVSGDRYGTAKLLYRDTKYFNCVSYAKAMTGVQGTVGDGARAAARQSVPRIGVMAAVRGSRPHAAVVVGISGSMITIHEANYTSGWITERVLPLSMFIGFVY